MERFPNPLDLSNVSIWERFQSKGFEKERRNLKVDGVKPPACHIQMN